MSAYDIEEFYVHCASVETFLGISPTDGTKMYSAAGNVYGLSIPETKIVRSAQGFDTTSNSQFYTYPVNAPQFTIDSRVTLNGVVSLVVAVAIYDSGSMDLPDNVEVMLS